MGRGWIALVGLVATLACGPSSVVLAADSEPVVDAGFRLRGSHGYSISVFAYSEEGDRRGTISFVANHHGASASYAAPATVTAEGIHADLGGLGRVDVVRHPSGRTKTVRPKCLGGRWTYEPATYEGTIEFNGEKGYTRAKENRVAQLPAWLLFGDHGPCGGGYGEATGPGEPGARLHGISFAHGRSLTFQVNKNGPRARTVFTASLKERHRGLRIYREVSGTAPASAFRFEPHLRTATLSPPSPFSGSASLSHGKNSVSPLWRGNLKLDFPGHAVSLAAPGVHVSLVHARFTRSSTSEVEIGF
jgi:hypothetical protein